eukprot:m.1024720 g.1024720  ORF g.1024720 m.1024720 type:complete len:470 (+) comp24099_c3_seq4:445-1854(+)
MSASVKLPTRSMNRLPPLQQSVQQDPDFPACKDTPLVALPGWVVGDPAVSDGMGESPRGTTPSSGARGTWHNTKVHPLSETPAVPPSQVRPQENTTTTTSVERNHGGSASPSPSGGRKMSWDPMQQASALSISTWEHMKSAKWTALFVVLYFTIGIVFYTAHQGWTFGYAIYFCVVVCTTVGYGDHEALDGDIALLFTSLFVLTGVGFVVTSLSLLIDKYRSARLRKLNADSLNLLSNLQLQEPRGDSGAGVSRSLTDVIQDEESVQGKQASRTVLLTFLDMVSGWAFGILFMTQYKKDGGENLTFVEALYFSIVTGTTVGFGDFSPQTQGGRIFAVFWIFYVVITTGEFLASVAAVIYPSPEEERLKELMDTGAADILRMCDTDSDSAVSYHEWLEAVMIATGKADRLFLDRVKHHFSNIAGEDMTLTKDDLFNVFNKERHHNTAGGAGAATSPRTAVAGDATHETDC